MLDEVLNRYRPAAAALSDWGKSHRFAGSGDRAAIGTLVYDALRERPVAAFLMGEETPRALMLGTLVLVSGQSVQQLGELFDGSEHSPASLSEEEVRRIGAGLPAELPLHVAARAPEWLVPSMQRVFGARLAEEGEALARRAPVDLRVNSLKATHDKVLKALEPYGAVATPHAPQGIRIPPPKDLDKSPNVEAEPGHGKGWFEVQDEGSQIAALLSGAGPRLQVLDLCAGAGGKTLAMAAGMHNTGQIYAYDTDKLQLRPIFDRLKRAGVRNAQVLPGGNETELIGLGDRFDVVLVDAPCSGSGTWRRRPDSKWRMRPQQLAERQKDQREVLELGWHLVKPGGRLVYVTCSVLPEENGDQVEAFLAAHPQFRLEPFAASWEKFVGPSPPASADGRADTLLLTPASHGTDGFFVAIMTRAA